MVRGPMHCWCCGQAESTSGCVRGFRCDCDLKLGIPIRCKLCQFCKKHCKCTEAMKKAKFDADFDYETALFQIREKFPDNVNPN